MSSVYARRHLVLLSLLVLLSGNAWAATYTFSLFGTSTPCTGSWSQNGSTFTCTGRVNLASGDILSVNSLVLGDITVAAAGGFTLNNNTIGTASKNISLETDYSTITATGTNNIYGSVKGGSGNVSLTGGTITVSLETASGSITLNGTTVSGTLTSTGPNNLTNATIGGAVQISSTLVATTSTFGNNVTTSGTASLSGGSVAGALYSNGSVTTTNATTIGGAVTSTNGSVSLGGGSVGGKVTGANGVTSNNTNITGDVTASGGAINLAGGTITGNVSGGCCQVTLTGLTLNGNASATNNDLVINSSTVTGNLTSTNNVKLGNTSVTGNVTAASWSTITGTGTSKVVGTCTPSLTSPVDLCQAPVTPTCITDNFNRTTLGTSDWAVTSRNGSFGEPRIVGNRLRLTDNSGNVATGATFQRLLPATSNYVQVQFKYYGYNGNGADGVAVIFSDASTTPQPGGYGGSLGYAQLNGTSGFAGGWLGIALDEYGNFSNPTETRNGGPGFRADSVSIRGSGTGTNGYAYLDGTAANLNPGIDVSGSTAGPGHTYRITVDSTVSGKSLVTVERNTGSGFTTLIPAFDARAKSGQAVLPSNFFMSLTGSTGGSNNIHELDDFQICASQMNPVGLQIDHFEYVYSGTALTCNPQPITIKACLNTSCSSLYTDPVSVTLSPTKGWNAISPATVSGNVINFSGGTAAVQLRSGAGEVVIEETDSVPKVRSLQPRVCSTSGCKIIFADSGFLISVPDLIAGKEAEATIQAVRKADNAAVCVPGFEKVTRNVGLNATYSDPSPGTKSLVINGTVVTTTTEDAAASATPTSFSLYFDDTGTVSPKPKVRYNDAGLMKLNASFVDSTANPGPGSSGHLITGTGQFVSRPYGLCILTGSPTGTDYSASSPLFANVRAGDLFGVQLRPVIWTSQTDALPPLVADNICWDKSVPPNPIEGTPNYQQTAIPLSLTILEPVGGRVASVLGADIATTDPYRYSHPLASSSAPNAPVTISRSIAEVGVFRLTAAPPTYLGATMTHAVSQSGRIGRFIPAYLSPVFSAALTPSCGTFSYQGQPISFASGSTPRLTVTGYNRGNQVTTNYDRGAFWRLGEPVRDAYVSVIASRPGLNIRLAKTGTVSSSVSDAAVGDGSKTYGWTGEQLLYNLATSPAVPGSEDYPVAASVRQTFAAGSLTDADGACYLGTGSTCSAYSFDFGGSDVRLGRLRIGNASGSELQSLSLPLALERWTSTAGGSFQTEDQDNCTVLGTPTLANYTSNLSSGETQPSVSAPAPLPASNPGVGSLALSAPGSGNDGSVQVSFLSSPTWLQYPWNGTVRQWAVGIATFGTYKGAAPLIFRREVYR